MLLDGETFDLVQHIDTVLQAISGHELEPRINAELMQSVLEIATPVCRNAGDIQRELLKLRAYVSQVGREKGMRVGSAGTHPFSLFERQRITARDRYRNLVDQLQYIARRELIFGMHVHVAVDDPEKAIQVVNGLLPQLGPLLALSASSPFWRGEPTGLVVEPADGLCRVPPLWAAAAVPRLRRLRRSGRPARADGLHRGLHPHLVGHPAASAARDGRDPDLRRDHARRGRGRARRVLPGARQAALRAVRQRRADPVVPPDPDHREQVAVGALRARGAGDGPRHRRAQPHSGRAADPPDAEGDRRRTRGSSAPSGSSRGSARSSRAGTAPIASCGSSTPTATSPRSSRRSRRRPKPIPLPPSSYGFGIRRHLEGGGVDDREPVPAWLREHERPAAVGERQAHGSHAPGRSSATAGRRRTRAAWRCRARGRTRSRSASRRGCTPRRRSRCESVRTARRSSPRQARACRRARRRPACRSRG